MSSRLFRCDFLSISQTTDLAEKHGVRVSRQAVLIWALAGEAAGHSHKLKSQWWLSRDYVMGRLARTHGVAVDQVAA